MPAANNIIEKIENHGYEAFLVGGCVRDSLLKIQNSDFDITTNARPDEIIEIFKDYKYIGFGKKFGTIKVFFENDEFEITTFRKEGAYLDKRHPGELEFTDDLLEDLKRRDFTINAMAMRKGEIIDPFFGRNDLEKKIIRAVGNPRKRIEEDFLRSLRAIRFAVKYDFKIEDSLKKAIKEKSKNIEFISKERINDELEKILISKRLKKGLDLMEEMNLLSYIFPHLTFDDNYEKYKEILKKIDETKRDLSLRLSMIFIYDKNKLEKSLSDLKFSKKIIRYCEDILFNLDKNLCDRKSIRELLRQIGENNFENLLDLKEIISKDWKNYEQIKKSREIFYYIKENEKLELDISGDDLIKLGFKEGKGIGDTLKGLEKLVDSGKIENDNKHLIKYIQNREKGIDWNSTMEYIKLMSM